MQNTHDLLVGTLSISIPSNCVLTDTIYQLTQASYSSTESKKRLMGRECRKKTAATQCDHYIPTTFS